jgi:3-methyladenine DNA glycosylase Tag
MALVVGNVRVSREQKPSSRETNACEAQADVPAVTPLAVEISKLLKLRDSSLSARLAWMQVVGLVNYHTVSCFRHSEIELLPRASSRDR